MFRYDENDRDKKALKKDWKKLDKQYRHDLEFKHIIDFYLTSSEQLSESIFQVSA